MNFRDLKELILTRLTPTFDVGWGCGHTDTYTMNVLKDIRKGYTIEKYYSQTQTYVVTEMCPYCQQLQKEYRKKTGGRDR